MIQGELFPNEVNPGWGERSVNYLEGLLNDTRAGQFIKNAAGATWPFLKAKGIKMCGWNI